MHSTLAVILLFAMTAGIFLALLGCQLFGYWLGQNKAQKALDGREGLGVVEGAVFALLGLMLAFQFAGAANRLDTRRSLAIREANAIGTAYLRLDLLDPEQATPLRELFHEYVVARVHALETGVGLDTVLAHIGNAERLQQSIWNKAIAACVGKPPQVPQLVLPAINEMIDLLTESKTISQTHAPILLYLFLVVLMLVGGVVAGNAMSRCARAPYLHMLIFAIVIACTMYLILDLEFPRLGFIRIGAADQPLLDLLNLFK